MRFQASISAQQKCFSPSWVIQKPENFTKKGLSKPTMAKNGKKYKWCNILNNWKGAWKFHCYMIHLDLSKGKNKGYTKAVHTQEPYGNLAMVENKEEDDEYEDGKHFH